MLPFSQKSFSSSLHYKIVVALITKRLRPPIKLPPPKKIEHLKHLPHFLTFLQMLNASLLKWKKEVHKTKLVYNMCRIFFKFCTHFNEWPFFTVQQKKK